MLLTSLFSWLTLINLLICDSFLHLFLSLMFLSPVSVSTSYIEGKGKGKRGDGKGSRKLILSTTDTLDSFQVEDTDNGHEARESVPRKG